MTRFPATARDMAAPQPANGSGAAGLPSAPTPAGATPGPQAALGGAAAGGTEVAGPVAAAPAGFTALVRLAVVSVACDGVITYWNRGAEELFQQPWEAVFGRPATGLITVPTGDGESAAPDPGPGEAAPGGGPAPAGRPGSAAERDAFRLLDARTRPRWTGRFDVVTRDGTVREVLCWSYRVPDGAAEALLVLAADAAALRAGALGIAVGERMLPYAPQHAAGAGGAHVVPRFAPGAADDPGSRAGGAWSTVAERLGAVLPRVGPGPLERIMRRVARLGHPALEIEGAAPLPVVPYEAVASAAAPVGFGERAPAAGAGASGVAVSGAGVSGAGGTAGSSAAGGRAELSPMRPAPPGSAGRPCRPGTAEAGPPRAVTGAPRATSPAGAAPAPAAPAVASAGADTSGVGADAASGGTRHGAPAVVPADSVPGPAAVEFPAMAPGQAVEQQLALLRETGTRVGTTLELETTAAELCGVAVPRFADFASVLIVDDVFAGPVDDPDEEGARSRVAMRRIAVANRYPGLPWESLLPAGELVTVRFRPADELTEPLLLPVVSPSIAGGLAADLGVPEMGPSLAGRSLLIAPLTARGTVLGRMCFVREPQRRPFNAKDTATAAEFAARGAVHLDNARLHQFESRAATTLQRSMLPTSPPRIPGVSIAHRYRPGDRQAQVGGDWFDAIQLPGGRVALIVGDVMGHGLLSAAVMGQFRTAVQTMAALDLPPAQLLRHLDNLAHRLSADHLATCIYTVYDPIHRTLTLANAGHIPPVLARHDGPSELLDIPAGAPIGVGGVPFETVEIPVPDGSWLVLCTDGLVEVRGQGIDAGLAALCANVIEPQQTPEDVCNQILSRVHSEDRRDDVALLVARFDGVAPRDVATWRFGLDPAGVRTARAVTRDQLAAWGLGHLTDLAELLVSELVTNALRVAVQEVGLRLMRVGKLLVEVTDDNHNLPQLRRADQDDENGRGLTLVSNLSQRWGTARKAVGKVVWFELPLPPGPAGAADPGLGADQADAG